MDAARTSRLARAFGDHIQRHLLDLIDDLVAVLDDAQAAGKTVVDEDLGSTWS